MKADVADITVGRRFPAKCLVPSPLQKTKSSGTIKTLVMTSRINPLAKECLPECLLLSFSHHDKLGVEEAG
jgi:hypothetical protein